MATLMQSKRRRTLVHGGVIVSKRRSSVQYLLRDDFTDALAAGSVDGTDATPGPGARAAGSTGEIVGGKYALGGSGATDNLGYESHERAAGRIFYVSFSEITSGNGYFGFAAASLGFPSQGGGFHVYADRVQVYIGVEPIVDTHSGTIDVFLIERASGMMMFTRKPAEATELKFITDVWGTSTPLFPVSWNNSGLTCEIDSVRIPDELWLPTPVASDGFGSAFGVTDGLGHEEGIAGGIGVGGGSVTWVQSVGAWATGSGVASASALSSGIAYCTLQSSTADHFTSVKLTRSAGALGLVLRWVDANNYIRLYHDGTSIELVEVIGGTPQAALFAAAATFSAGAELVSHMAGTSIRVIYNNANVSTATVDSALTGLGVGLYTTDTGNSFDDFLVHKSTDHSQLDKYRI